MSYFIKSSWFFLTILIVVTPSVASAQNQKASSCRKSFQKQKKPNPSRSQKAKSNRKTPSPRVTRPSQPNTLIEIFEKAKSGDMHAQYEIGNLYRSGEQKIKQDFSQALQWFLRAAKQGLMEAQYEMALFNHQGLGGLAQNIPEAIRWLKNPIEQEDPEAQFLLGLIHENGNGIPKDREMAIHLYRLAAEQGHPEAQVNLGSLLEEGTPGQLEEAVYWYTVAAEQNAMVQAQYNLGILYFIGKGVKQNFSQALKLFTQAAQKGDVESTILVGSMHEKGQGILKMPEEAIYWYKKAIQKGSHDAQFKLASLLDRGINQNEKNPVEAFPLFLEIAKKGHPEAQYRVGHMLKEGRGVHKNSRQALIWFHKSAEQGLAQAQYMLSKLYEQGQKNILNQDPQQAQEFFNKAIEQEYPLALYEGALNYLDGVGQFEKDETKSITLLTRAAELDHVKAQGLLARFFLNGHIVSRDPIKARYWFEKASLLGDTRSLHTFNYMKRAGMGTH